MKNEILTDVPKRAVIYCRVSTKEQVNEGNSLVSQERICREYAFNEGYELSQIFIEKGESAKTAERPELQNMLAYCANKQNQVEVVIAYKVDRISRNIADYSYIKVKLKKNNIVIRSVTEFFEDTPAGRFMENIIANVSQFDNEVRTERSVGGMKEAVQEGRYVWKAPLGYDNKKVDNKSTIVPNDIAPLIKETFELVAKGHYSTEVIRHIMQSKGLCDKYGGCVTRSYFYRLLQNPLYKGVIKKFGMTYPGKYEPIVSEELYEQVQNVLKGKKNKTKQYLLENPDFPLRRFVFTCDGKPLTGYWSKGKRKKYPYYSFSKPGTTIRKEELERKFMIHLSKCSFKTEQLVVLKRLLEEHFDKHLKNDAIANGALEKREEELNKQIDALIALHSQGNISEAILNSRIKKHEAELEELASLSSINSNNKVDLDGLLQFVNSFLLAPQSIWRKSHVYIRRKIQEFVFPQGIVFNGTNFRTPKLCNIFEAKHIMSGRFDPKVASGVSTKNNGLRTNLPPSDP
ncbi:MAG: recombinase family protein, partial [Bacteroidetes bacterium]|nr:recombinase family protein [Bacteroidota bacterium]